MKNFLIIVVAYLLGSIPFGYLIVRTTRGADVRETGSGGTGATNVSRSAGKFAGVLTLLLDALKGAAAIAVARLLLGVSAFSANASWWIAVAAVAVLIGHIFPMWLGFRGGKGVATGVGVFLILSPISVVAAAIVFFVIVLLTRYVSLGSIVAAIAVPIVILIDNSFTPDRDFQPVLFAAIACAALIVFAHRANIGRLFRGTESKFR
ncbi:MAG: glycerol-3-phosphate 1-O-acyltransferase PlsY [Pyrinomonadaceae bacterium]